MRTITEKEIFVFDNGGETLDRYTIIFKEDASLFGASENPFHPQGFGQYCGEIEPKELNEFSYENVNEYIGEARADSSWLGKEITDINDLPINVIKYIEQISS